MTTEQEEVPANIAAALTEISEHAVTGGFSDITAIVKDSFGSIDALYEQGREVTGLAGHPHVVVRRQEPAEPLADNGVVVDDQDRRRLGRNDGASHETPPDRRGTAALPTDDCYRLPTPQVGGIGQVSDIYDVRLLAD